jgi:hypothetical protein
MQHQNPIQLEEQLKIYYHKKPKTTSGRNAEIHRVYNKIVYEIRLLLFKIPFKKKQRFIETDYSTNPKKDVFKEFVCLFCSVTLSTKNRNFIIEFDTDNETEKIIGSQAYNAFIRIAFKYSMADYTSFDIENCLQIDLNKTSQYDYFLKRQIEEDTRICAWNDEDELIE